MLNLQICTVIIMKKKKKKHKKKKIIIIIKKNHAIPEIRTRDTLVESPPRYPLRYGGQCNFQIKIINIC